MKFIAQDKPGQIIGGDGPLDYLSGFARSTLSGGAELFGFEAAPEVEAFRDQNPIGGMASQLVGFGVPYVGWYKAGTKIPKLMSAVDKAGEASKSRFVSGALQEATMFAPFEAARTLVGTTLGDASVGEMLKDNALSLGVGMGVGGAFKSLAGKPKVMNSVEGFLDAAAPTQMQLRQLREAQAQAEDPVALNSIGNAISRLRRAVIEEDAPTKLIVDAKNRVKKTGVFVSAAKGNTDAAQVLNRMFRRGQKLRSSREGAFKSDESVGITLKDAGIDRETFEQFVRFPRAVVLPKAVDGQRNLRKSLARTTTKISDDIHLYREPEDGLYVVSKRVEGKAFNGYLVFKTDSPEVFAPAQAKWTDELARKTAWEADRDIMKGQSELLDVSLTTVERVTAGKMSEKARSELAESLAQGASKYFIPRMFQLQGSAIGRSMLMAMEATFDLAQAKARMFAYGTRGFSDKKMPLAQVLTGKLEVTGGVSVKDLADKIEDWGEIRKVLDSELPFEDVVEQFKAGKMRPESFALLRTLQTVSDTVDQTELLPLQKIMGIEKYAPKSGHYGIPRTRPGDHRVRILNENGDTVELVGGFSSNEAMDLADRVVAQAKAAGANWTKEGPFLRDAELDSTLLEEYGRYGAAKGPDRALARKLLRKSMSDYATTRNFKERKNVKGYFTDWDAESLTEAFAAHLDMKFKFAASMAAQQAVRQYADKLVAISGQGAFDIVSRRMNDFMGTQGDFSKSVNAFTDKALSPLLGKNSATKIAGATNKFYMHMTLGALNIAYPAINALTFTQTVLPHLAFIRNAPKDMLEKYYDSVIVGARDGVQGANTVSGLKMAAQGAKLLATPDEGFKSILNRAANDGTIDPKIIEDYMGENAQKYLNLKESFSSPLGFARGIKGVALVTMESGERLSRTHALGMGYLVGKDFLKLEGDKLYAFTKRFTENTMYRYGTPDRATLFAGPVGSVFGLFKNWMSHYMMWMIEHSKMAGRNPTSMAAWSPLLWQMAGTSAVGGIGAWPFFSMADNFSKFASDATIMEHVYGNMRIGDSNAVSDAIYYGLPSVLGLSLSAQAQMPFHAPLRDAEFMFMPVHIDRMQALGRAIGDTAARFDAFGRFNPLQSEQLTLEWARALGPKIAYRSLQTQADGSIVSARTGAPMIQNVGTLDRVAYALGFNPPEITRTFDVANQLWESQAKRQSRVQALGQEWKEAQDRQDFKAVNDVMRRSMALGIDPSRVLRSAQTRLSRAETDMINHAYSPEEIWKFRNSLQRE